MKNLLRIVLALTLGISLNTPVSAAWRAKSSSGICGFIEPDKNGNNKATAVCTTKGYSFRLDFTSETDFTLLYGIGNTLYLPSHEQFINEMAKHGTKVGNSTKISFNESGRECYVFADFESKDIQFRCESGYHQSITITVPKEKGKLSFWLSSKFASHEISYEGFVNWVK